MSRTETAAKFRFQVTVMEEGLCEERSDVAAPFNGTSTTGSAALCRGPWITSACVFSPFMVHYP